MYLLAGASKDEIREAYPDLPDDGIEVVIREVGEVWSGLVSRYVGARCRPEIIASVDVAPA